MPRAHPPAPMDAVELMVSELATNSVKHAHSDFKVSIKDSGGEIRVEVRDTGRGQPVLRFPAPTEPSGRRLRIVEASRAHGEPWTHRAVRPCGSRSRRRRKQPPEAGWGLG